MTPENGFSNSTIEGLRSLGHNVEVKKSGYGGYQAIRYDEDQDVYYGATECRKDGSAMGL